MTNIRNHTVLVCCFSMFFVAVLFYSNNLKYEPISLLALKDLFFNVKGSGFGAHVHVMLGPCLGILRPFWADRAHLVAFGRRL